MDARTIGDRPDDDDEPLALNVLLPGEALRQTRMEPAKFVSVNIDSMLSQFRDKVREFADQTSSAEQVHVLVTLTRRDPPCGGSA